MAANNGNSNQLLSFTDNKTKSPRPLQPDGSLPGGGTGLGNIEKDKIKDKLSSKGPTFYFILSIDLLRYIIQLPWLLLPDSLMWRLLTSDYDFNY